MPFYWMAVKPWVSDMKRVVACIEIAGNKNHNKLMDLSDVKSVNDLMLKKAMPIRNITFKYAEASCDDRNKTDPDDYDYNLEPLIGHDESLGETLERMKRIKKAKRRRRNQYHRRRSTTTCTSIGVGRKVHNATKTPFGTWRPTNSKAIKAKVNDKEPETTQSERLTPTELKSLLCCPLEGSENDTEAPEQTKKKIHQQHIKRPSLPVLPSEQQQLLGGTTDTNVTELTDDDDDDDDHDDEPFLCLPELGADPIKVEDRIHSDIEGDKQKEDVVDDYFIDPTMGVLEGDFSMEENHSLVGAVVAEEDDDDDNDETKHTKNRSQKEILLLDFKPFKREETASEDDPNFCSFMEDDISSVASDLTNSCSGRSSIVLPPIACHDNEDYYHHNSSSPSAPPQSQSPTTTTTTTTMKSCMRVKTMKESLMQQQRDSSPSQPKRSSGSHDSAPSAPCRRTSLSESTGCDELIRDDDSASDSSSRSSNDNPNDDMIDNSESLHEYYANLFHESQLVDTSADSSKVLVQSPSQQQQQPRRRELRWGHIEIREYDICLGDNPACGKGCPIQLDWTYTVLQEPIDLDQYYDCWDQQQKQRQSSSSSSSSGLRRLSGRKRQQILLDLGYTPTQMKKVMNIKLSDQKKRIQTVSRLKYMKFDEHVERIVHRVFPQVA